jgi:hypothetical protein
MNPVKWVLAIAVALVLLRADAAADPDNFCHDESTWRQWTELMRENPGDDQLQMLHALRIGLCVKVEQGSITFDRANELFNRAHETIIRQRRQEETLGKRNSEG